MKKLVFSGTFDPVTIGHLDIIQRASKISDELIVAVAEHTGKQAMWSIEQRLKFLEKAIQEFPNVKVYAFSGLLVNFIKEHQAHAIIRGVRSVVDWSYEAEMAGINAKLLPGLETIFLPAKEQISSTFVRQIWTLGGDISAFVPKNILDLMNH